MTPIKDLLFGDPGEEPREWSGDEDPVERLHQLRRGMEEAVASLPEEHVAVGRRALEAARSVETSLEGDEAAESRARRASEGMARLHFALVRLAVEEEAVEEEVEDAIRGLTPAGGEMGADS